MTTTTETTPLAQAESATYTVDSFNNGVVFGQHRSEGEDERSHYTLRLSDQGDLARLRSRYVLNKNNPFWELERSLMRLSRRGVLGSSLIYFGVSTDPFFPFDGKFDASMKFLQLFERYTPGLLIIQTRSPLIVIAMPILKKLAEHVSVTIGLETHLEEAVQSYTPGLPRVNERLKTAASLRRFGVEVTLQAGPVLPYGRWREDAGEFAQVLTDNSDYIYCQSLVGSLEGSDRKVRQSQVARRLAQERKFHWLRPDSAQPLADELQRIAPDKLQLPERRRRLSKQMKIFAA